MDNGQERNRFQHVLWIIFPEITSTSIVVILAPFLLIQMYTNGEVLFSIIGFSVWLVSIFYTINLIKREQCFLAGLPMAEILLVGLIINYAIK